MVRRRWIVTGRVQGVGFRAWVQYRATSLGLAGWTRNVADGSVEVEAEGSAEEIAAFELMLRQGPRHAAVRSVTSSESAAKVREDADGADALPQPFMILRD